MAMMSKICCLRRLHPDLEARVTAKTLSRYRKELVKLINFAESFPDPMIDSPEELDHMLFCYKDDVALTKSKHITLIAAIEFHIPRWKGLLVDTKEALKGRQRIEPTKHTVPFTKGASILFASHMSSRGSARMGAGLIIQTGTGLRPSELLSLLPESIHIPLVESEHIVIRLGNFVSAKAKREQFVLVKFADQPLAYNLITVLHANTLPGERIFPYTYWEYRNLIVDIDKQLDLHLGLSAHSGRAAFATEGVVAGLPLQEIQAAGRWLSETSFRIYIDIIGASAVGTHVKAKGYSAAIDWCCSHVHGFLGADRIREDTGPKKVRLSGQIGRALASPEDVRQISASSSPHRTVTLRQPSLAGERAAQVQMRGPPARQISDHDQRRTGPKGQGKGLAGTKGKGRGRAVVVYR